MLVDAQKAYWNALAAVESKEYSAALGFLKSAEIQFTADLDFRILKETVKLLLAVKNEIGELRKSGIV
jgi:hypothetical protein